MEKRVIVVVPVAQVFAGKMNKFRLAIAIEIIGIAALIAGLLLTHSSPGTTLTLGGAALIAIGSLLFFKVFRR